MRKKDFHGSDIDEISVGPIGARLDIKNTSDAGATLEIKRGKNSLLKLLTDNQKDLQLQQPLSAEFGRRRSHESVTFSLKQDQLVTNNNLSSLRKKHLQF